MVILGFARVGAPSTQRMLRADARRVQDLYQLSEKVRAFWNLTHKLPEHLDELQDVVLADPITRAGYEYHLKDESKYELCATFAMSSQQNEAIKHTSAWSHIAGRQCFPFDAVQMADNPYVYYPN